MSAFVNALQSFRSGATTLEDLLSEVYRLLVVEKTSPVILLEALAAEQRSNPVAPAAHQALLSRLEDWPQDPTIVTGVAALPRDEKSKGPYVGDVLQGRFSLVALIGSGGMSRVFKAIDLRRVEARAADPHIAMKVLTEPFNEYFGSIVALQREAHKLQSLMHPNIVRVIDVDRDGQVVFMTMEYLPGESLQKKIRAAGNIPMDPEMVASWIWAIGNALEYAHGNDIVHGDLKPANVIVADHGTVKVIDFGVARFVTRPGGGARPPNANANANPNPNPNPRNDNAPRALTLRYASPEMAAGHDPSPADDVYALAAIAYELLTGTPAFAYSSESNSFDKRILPARPAGMTARRYQAIADALVFNPEARTATIRRFLNEFLAPERQLQVHVAAWIAVTTMVVGMGLWLAVHRSAPHVAPARIVEADSFAAGAVIRDCPTCPLMTVLPAGRFMQGRHGVTSELSPSEGPAHAVAIAYRFAMSTNEVTVAEFREFAETTRRNMAGCTTYDGEWRYQPSASWRSPGFAQSGQHPVTCVSWNDAAAYARWLSQKSAGVYRLASASEWEYAARAGGGAGQPWGSNERNACAEANVADQNAAQRFPGWVTFPCSDGYVNTAPVGTFKANAFGMNDLLGNVFEWVEDCWYDDYANPTTDGSARVTPACLEHELRGGSWFSSPRFVSASYRNRFAAGYRSSSIGFRLVREIER